MKRLILFILCGFWSIQHCHSQTMTWSATTSYIDGNKHSCRDAAGNIYLFQNQDTIKKINSFGNVLSQMTLPANMTLSNLVATPDTGFYLCGNYTGTLAIGSNTYSSLGNKDIWFARYNKLGTLIWFKSFGSKGDDGIGDMCISPSGFVITGALSDTLYFLGQTFPKVKQTELFVATFNGNGALLAHKFAVSTNTQTYVAFSQGKECEVDAAGNIYLLSYAVGTAKLDTFTIGNWGSDPYQPPGTVVVIKLNSALQPQLKPFYFSCLYCHFYFNNLCVRDVGEIYFVEHYSYGQSGGDDQSVKIYHINPSGLMTGTFSLRPDLKSDISDLEIDKCGNVYFTGYWYSHWSTSSFFAASVLAKLNPQLTLNWMMNDSSQTRVPIGVGLCLLDSNRFFMHGYSSDTITDVQGVFPGLNKIGFFEKVKGPANSACLSTASLLEKSKANLPPTIFPNPSAGKFYLSDDAIGSQLKLFNSQGLLIRDEKQIGKELTLNEFPEGVYFIRLTDASGRSNSGKLVLVK